MAKVLYENYETWLICGGRDFSDVEMFDNAMSDIMNRFGHPSQIVHGAAKGADSMAGELAKRMAIDVVSCPANWKKLGRSAGPIRNRRMLSYQPDKIIAFPGGRGTADMIEKGRKAKIDVIEIRAQQ